MSTVSRMKELEEENRRLKKMEPEYKLRGKIVAEAFEKSGEAISRKGDDQEGGDRARYIHPDTCEAFRISESCYRYERKLDAENAEVANWLIRLTDNHRNWTLLLVFA